MSAHLDRRTFLRRAIGAAGWALAVPLLAACGPAAAPAPTAAPAKPAEAPKPAAPVAPPAAPAPTTAPAAPAGVTKISYAMVTYSPYHIVPISAAEKPELMRKHGAEIDIIITNNSPNSVNAMVGGSVNFAGVTPESGWPAQAQTPDIQQVIGVANGTPYQLFVTPEIKQVAELKGKTLGASAARGGADTTAMQILLLENGLKEGDYSIVQVGPIAERTAAMKAGTIFGCAQQEPQSTQLRDAGFVELDDADNYPALKNVQTLVVLSRKNWYQSNMDSALRFVRAWVDITKWVYDPANKDELLGIMVSTMKVDQKAAENAYQRWWVKAQTATSPPLVDLKMAAQQAENQKRVGNTSVPDDFSKFVDNSLVEKALT